MGFGWDTQLNKYDVKVRNAHKQKPHSLRQYLPPQDSTAVFTATQVNYVGVGMYHHANVF